MMMIMIASIIIIGMDIEKFAYFLDDFTTAY